MHIAGVVALGLRLGLAIGALVWARAVDGGLVLLAVVEVDGFWDGPSVGLAIGEEEGLLAVIEVDGFWDGPSVGLAIGEEEGLLAVVEVDGFWDGPSVGLAIGEEAGLSVVRVTGPLGPVYTPPPHAQQASAAFGFSATSGLPGWI